MIWSPQQDSALQHIAKWLREPEGQPIFRLFGYAGTGKTTLVKHIAEGVDGEVLFAAPTGKSALVMRKKGCSGASTIHSLIYHFEAEDKKGRPQFKFNPNSRLRNANLLVIDECSMVDTQATTDLLRFRVPMLVIGDTAQLFPPDGCGFFTAFEPDVMLTEIHRQALGSPIIAMSKIVREGGRLSIGCYGDSRVVHWRDVGSVEDEQILVGLNRTRRDINARYRAQHGMDDPLPLQGDKLVCLQNDHGKGLLNGSLWVVQDRLGTESDGTIRLLIRPEDGGDAIGVETHEMFFRRSDPDPWERQRYDQFDYGYALTVHKAQGSQWNSVILADESVSFRKNRARWLYTGITRAAERITVVIR